MLKFLLSLILCFTFLSRFHDTVAMAQSASQEKNASALSYSKTKIVEGSLQQAYKFTLKNGLTFIVVPDNRNPIATLHFMLDAGSNREKLGQTGLAHFFEHMMFRKAQNAPEGNYDRVLNSIGGSGNAGTSESFVTFYSNFPAPALETMLKLESYRFMHLDIMEPYFSTEKGAVISERKLRVENNPLQRGQEILRTFIERDTPLQWMTIGAKADVEAMSIHAAQKFYQEFYTPDNTLVVLGGPFKPLEAYALVEKYFGQWQGKLTEKHSAYSPNYYTRDLGKSFVCSAPISTKHYQMIYPSAQSNLESYVYSNVFQAMLDDHLEGSLARRFVKAQLATNFYFYQMYWQNQTNPYIAIFSLNKNQDFNKAKDFWLKNVHDILNKPLTEKIKKQVLKQMAVANAEAAEKMTSLVSTVIDNTFFFHDFYAAGKAENLVKNMKEKDFKEWIAKNLNDHHFYTTGIVPAGEATSCLNDNMTNSIFY